MPSADSRSSFRTLQRFTPDYAPCTITKYESERTGMSVVVVDREGPKVNGFFALATEIHDDSGAPHTLEHLCFMGSKSYRYKGVLDKLATRAYSNTNAWTATDHTAYTLDTAGWDGFAQILPIYLEHVIVPTLTDAGCYTEVHHVDGSGHDAGVVYSEMQGVQNTQGELMELRSKRLMYPESVGFRYETGGMMEQLRVLTADRIRKFHRDMYQPKNLCLVIVGDVDHTDLLQILGKFETTILDDIPRPDAPFKRPWVESDPAPPLTKSTLEFVEFPEEDESSGEITISFFGPSCNDLLYATALNILLVYLAGSSASVLENTLVEKERVASAVYYSVEIRPTILIQFALSSVATERLMDVEGRFFEVLKKTAANQLDMTYLRDCIARERRLIKDSAESSSTPFSEPIIYDFLFANRDGSMLKEDLENLNEFNELLSWPEDKWRQLIKLWMSDAHHATILGKPSATLSKRLKSEEKARIEDQKKRLGREGLEALEKKLAQAKAENDRDIPKELLEKFHVPSTKSIHFIGTTTARSGAAKKLGHLQNKVQKLVDSDDTESPLFIHFEHVQSNFAHVNLVISTEAVPIELRPLLSVYLENMFTSPIERNGNRIEFEQVIMELEKDTVGYAIGLGSALGNPEVLNMRISVEVEKYASAIQWLKKIIWSGIFDVERIASTTVRLLADIPEAKRSGSNMLSAVEEMIHSAPASIVRARSTLVNAVYLKGVRHLLKENPNIVIGQLQQIRDALFEFQSIRAVVVANIEKLSKPVSSWKVFTADLDTSSPLNPIEKRLSRLSEAGRNPGQLSYVIPMPTIDSSFALSVASGPSSLQDARVPALMVALSYLDAVEGPMWAAVRGTGLAYGTSFSRHTESGQVSYSVYRSPNAFKAFQTGRSVLEDFVSGKTEFDKLALEGAISSIVLGFANGQATMAAAAQMSFVRQVMRELPDDWNERMLEKVRGVKVEEIRAAMKDVVLPVLTAGTANLIVTCAPVMEEEVVKGFQDLGFQPEVRPLAYFQDDYGIKVPMDEKEEDVLDGADISEGEDDDNSSDESDS
ncbi:MAG: hypothetical protein L6R42_004425 [Xanthoria sp. 1 TBL-2021]|nr:MAG: hypothetical protein L6R42_004425 [Xanthoria sp. 1 TBL-2021]